MVDSHIRPCLKHPRDLYPLRWLPRPSASQMLAASMPVTSLQRYHGHELMDTTMFYAEVSNPLLQQDYYRGITTIDPQSANLAYSSFQLEQLRQLIDELKTDDLEPLHQKEILEQMQSLLDNTE